METFSADETKLGEHSKLELLDFQTEMIVKRSTLRKYKILCAVLFVSLVVVALGLGLGLGLKKSAQPQVSCRYTCNETFSEETSGCSCDDKCTERQACCWDYEDACVLPTQSWSCSKLRCGEKRMAKMLCSCSEDCLEKKDCCTDYKSICKGETSWLKDQCVSSSAAQCPAGCQPHEGFLKMEPSTLIPLNNTEPTLPLPLVSSKLSLSWFPNMEVPAPMEADRGTIGFSPAEICTECTNVCREADIRFEQNPLILFSMDGFRAEYLETWSALMPNILKLKTCGTHAKYMRAVYPTKTFVNHYTIVTGLYPESHGIIDNNMYDEKLNHSFSLSGIEKSNPAWWGGQPIWLTAIYQGLKTATYFWPGSDVKINGSFPTIYKVYNKSVPYEARVSELLKWLDLPKSERPNFYTLYIEEPDTTGHKFGPLRGEVIKALQLADRTLGMLMEGLKQRNLHNCVNLILLADHGMEKISCNQLEYMSDYFNKINFYMYEGPAPRIRASVVPENFYTFDSEGIVKNLTCRKPKQHFKAYLAKDLPKRLHYVNNIRIDKVNLMVDQQWMAVRYKTYKYCEGGTHGYDNEFKSMEAIFVAHGPGFKEKTEVKSFENIEVYNLMCDLLKIKPAPNNGTHGSLNHLLKIPFYNPSPAEEQSSPLSCPFASLPSPDASGCTCNSIADLEAANQRLNLSNQAKMEAEAHNLPYGRPQVLQKHSKYCLLHQTKYVSAYSQDIWMPLWNSYTVSKSLGNPPSAPPTVPDCLRLDVRIPAAQSQNCSSYQPDLNITHGFLYLPNFSSSVPEQYDALVTSNIVPMYKEFKRLWDYFHRTLLPKYATERNGLNVISGPIFDYNYDGLFDSRDINTKYVTNTEIPIPTHYFVVLTSCEDPTSTPLKCSGSLKVLSFILPHRPDNSESCADTVPENLWVEERMHSHTARVRDVELLTGLNFYPELKQPLSKTLQLKTFLPVFQT